MGWISFQGLTSPARSNKGDLDELHIRILKWFLSKSRTVILWCNCSGDPWSHFKIFRMDFLDLMGWYSAFRVGKKEHCVLTHCLTSWHREFFDTDILTGAYTVFISTAFEYSCKFSLSHSYGYIYWYHLHYVTIAVVLYSESVIK